MLMDIELMNYEEYLLSANEEETTFINELNKQGVILNEGIEKIKAIKEPLNILVITSTRCKDSATIIPFLMKLAEFNKNINIKFLLKNNNEDMLEKMSGETRIPTIMLLNDKGEVQRKIIEFPLGVKKILLENSKEKTQEIIDDMRSGKYNKLIQEDIISLFTGEKYMYTSFVRKDK